MKELQDCLCSLESAICKVKARGRRQAWSKDNKHGPHSSPAKRIPNISDDMVSHSPGEAFGLQLIMI